MRTAATILLIALLFLTGCQTEALMHSEGENAQLKLHEDEHDLTAYPYEDISDGELDALNRALDDEYKALATYRQVIADFGEQKPFVNIAQAEENHVVELLALYEKYDLPIIDDRWSGAVDSYGSLVAACTAGEEAETANAALYDEIFSLVDNQDIAAVFSSLQSASRDKHLPAFQKCGGLR